MADGPQVQADLVGPSGDRPHQKESFPLFPRQNPELRLRFLPYLLYSHAPGLVGIAAHAASDEALVHFHLSLHGCQIFLEDLPLLELLDQGGVGLFGAGQNEGSGGQGI